MINNVTINFNTVINKFIITIVNTFLYSMPQIKKFLQKYKTIMSVMIIEYIVVLIVQLHTKSIYV